MSRHFESEGNKQLKNEYFAIEFQLQDVEHFYSAGF